MIPDCRQMGKAIGLADTASMKLVLIELGCARGHRLGFTPDASRAVARNRKDHASSVGGPMSRRWVGSGGPDFSEIAVKPQGLRE